MRISCKLWWHCKYTGLHAGSIVVSCCRQVLLHSVHPALVQQGACSCALLPAACHTWLLSAQDQCC